MITIACPICKFVFPPDKPLNKLEADCEFLPIAGVSQHLIRYQCSNCDVVFGSEEMINLSADRLSKAYQELYNSGHREGDTTHVELSLFNMLKPTTSGIYVNWGAGTNRTSIELAKQGYQLFNYDPGIPSNVPGYISADNLKNLKFDGIISNNVLDHLQNPIYDLLLMKSLLKPGGKMVHASDGFRYRINYTKFHLYFFIGKSTSYLSQTIGMSADLILLPNEQYDILVLE
jgi:hypothetical protein